MNYIVIDLEFNQPYEFEDGTRTVKIDACPFEIIQMGVVKLNENLELLGTANYLIKPQVYERVHPFVTKITGITDEMLCDKTTFQEAFSAMIDFIGEEDYIFGVWGSPDVKLLYKNVVYFELDTNVLSTKFINIQQLASKNLQKPQGMSIGLRNAVESFNIEIENAFHDALNDAVYTAEIFRIVQTDKMEIQKFKIQDLYTRSRKYVVNLSQLFAVVEKDFGRRLNRKEKEIFKKVYMLGRSRQFDAKI